MLKLLLSIKSFFILIISVVCVPFSFAQQNKIDSLITVLNTSIQDTTKTNTLNALFLHFEYTDTVKAKEYLNKALDLAQKNDYKNGLAITYKYLGFLAEDKGKFQESLKNYFASQKIFEAMGDKKGIAASSNNIGGIFKNQGNYMEALKYYIASLKIYEEIGKKSDIASSYNNIGLVYDQQGNYPEAFNNHLKSLKIYEAIGDKKGIATSYNNIGIIFFNQGNYSESLKNHKASLKIREEIDDKKAIAMSFNNIGIIYSQQGNYPEALKNYIACLKIMEAIGSMTIADVYNNIGNVYTQQSNYPEALKNHLAALKIKEYIGDQAGIAASYVNIGTVFIKHKRYKEAGEYLLKAKSFSRKIGNKNYLKYSYHALTELDSAKGNFKGAYENHKLYILYRDSLDNEESRKKTIQSQMTYDFEKKEAIAKLEEEKKDAAHAAQSKQQRLIIYSVIAGLLLVLTFSFFLFKRFRITKKQKNIIEQQKQEVEKQKEMVEEKNTEILNTQSQLVHSEKMASLGQLTAGVAHEINNPVSFISGGVDSISQNYHEIKQLLVAYSMLHSSELSGNESTVTPDFITQLHKISKLRKDMDFDFVMEETEHLLHTIKDGTIRTTGIVKSLQSFSRLDESDMKRANLHEGIDSTLTILTSKLENRIEVVKQYGELSEINCLPGQINQMFLNILNNAIDAIAGNGTILIKTAVVNNCAEIRIKDSGIGITEDTKRRLFEPFFTTKDVGKGTGLGLSIVHGIITKHKGKIDVESEPGKGTEFIMQIPVNLS